MDQDEAREYLTSLLNKNLRVHTTDGRLFWGTFKCTDPVCAKHPFASEPRMKITDCGVYQDKNIVLANTYEYRKPSQKERTDALAKLSEDKVTLDMESRYLGLVVVPGEHIVRMELEQFASQMK